MRRAVREHHLPQNGQGGGDGCVVWLELLQHALELGQNEMMLEEMGYGGQQMCGEV